jgi:hypothetical protein
MKNKILSYICGILMLVSVSCAGIQVGVNPEVVDVAIEVSAFTLGYEGCKKNRPVFEEMADVASFGLKLVEVDELKLSELVSELKSIGADYISSDPLTRYQVNKLLSLLDIDLDSDEISIGKDKNEYVMLAIEAFIQGVNACAKPYQI